MFSEEGIKEEIKKITEYKEARKSIFQDPLKKQPRIEWQKKREVINLIKNKMDTPKIERKNM